MWVLEDELLEPIIFQIHQLQQVFQLTSAA